MHTLGFMGMPGQMEIVLIVFIILLLFGAKKLPELSRSLGKSLGEFKKGQKEGAEPDHTKVESEATDSASNEEPESKA